METENADSIENLVLIEKWGFDGSTGHREYKQTFSNNNLDDKSLFVTSYVPLQLISKSQNKIIWKNLGRLQHVTAGQFDSISKERQVNFLLKRRNILKRK